MSATIIDLHNKELGSYFTGSMSGVHQLYKIVSMNPCTCVLINFDTGKLSNRVFACDDFGQRATELDIVIFWNHRPTRLETTKRVSAIWNTMTNE